MLAVGVDTHKESLAVCAVDEVGRLVAEETFTNDPAGHADCVVWLEELPAPRRVGVEGSAHLGAALSDFLTRHGLDVYEVPAVRTDRERRRTGRPGKSDLGDALAIARVVARDEGLSSARYARPEAQTLRLLTDYRDELGAEAGRLAQPPACRPLRSRPRVQSTRHSSALSRRSAPGFHCRGCDPRRTE